MVISLVHNALIIQIIYKRNSLMYANCTKIKTTLKLIATVQLIGIVELNLFH